MGKLIKAYGGVIKEERVSLTVAWSCAQRCSNSKQYRYPSNPIRRLTFASKNSLAIRHFRLKKQLCINIPGILYKEQWRENTYCIDSQETQGQELLVVKKLYILNQRKILFITVKVFISLRPVLRKYPCSSQVTGL